jgi:aminoglycoside phosphotransferase family enzyme/predicted kinase
MREMVGEAHAEESAGRLPAMIAAMLRPEFYPERPARVEFRQTHISCVFLAGDSAYKIKKPVRFTFLDASSLARRHVLCLEEVRLNRRLAPEVYAGVHSIVQSAGGFALGPEAPLPDPNAIEYAVKMRRLPDEWMLDRMVAENRADAKLMHAIAARLAEFHRTAPADRAWTYGSAAAVWRGAIANIAEAERFVGYTVSDADFSAIEEFVRTYTGSHWEMFNRRAHGGRIREGHGDLRCEHVCIGPAGRILIIDCIEFSEQLRYGDIASDVGFLAMDLERLGARKLADELIGAYAELAGDDDLPVLLPFYKCCRAAIRGKVESLRSREPEVDPGERERARQLAEAAFALAVRYARRSAPALVAVCGRSGTGKSTLARTLRNRNGFEILSSDHVRKRIAGIAPEVHARAPYKGGIYSDEFTRRAYEALLAEARALLDEGRGVILDATFKDHADRAAALRLAAQRGVPALFVECRADEAEVIRRLRARADRPDEVSDATTEIFRQQAAEFEPLTEIAARNRLVVDTTRGYDEAADQVERALDALLHVPAGAGDAL